MKIFAISDLHAKLDRLTWIGNVVETEKPDLLLLAGDIISYLNPAKTIQPLSRLNLPIYYIRGNSDPVRLDRCAKDVENLNDLNLKQVKLGGINLVGISGAVLLPFRSRVRLFEKRVVPKVEKLINRESILVVHPPPFGTKDKIAGKFNGGSKMLRDLVSRCSPSMVVCGHIHEDPGEFHLGESLVLNCSLGRGGKGVIIETTDSDQKPAVRFL